MPTYRYKIAVPGGQIVERTAVAESKSALKNQLEKEGNFVLHIRQTDAMRLGDLQFKARRRFSTKEFFSFNQEFSVLVKSGLSIVAALDASIRNREKGELRDLLDDIRRDIASGESLSNAFAKYSHLFTKLYIATLRAGEKSGDIPTALLRYINYMKTNALLKRKIISASVYPLILTIASVAVLLFLLVHVVPAISATFLEAGSALPPITQALISFSEFVRAQILYCLLCIGIVCAVFWFYKRTPAGQLFYDRLRIRLPFFGNLYIAYITSKFTRTLSTLLKAGITLIEATRISVDAVNNQFVAARFKGVIKQLESGDGFAESMRGEQVLPPLALRMVDAGEAGGALPTVLNEIADFYDEEVSNRLAVLTSAIEPMLMLTMGVLIGFIVLAMYLPIFQLAGTIG